MSSRACLPRRRGPGASSRAARPGSASDARFDPPTRAGRSNRPARGRRPSSCPPPGRVRVGRPRAPARPRPPPRAARGRSGPRAPPRPAGRRCDPTGNRRAGSRTAGEQHGSHVEVDDRQLLLGTPLDRHQGMFAAGEVEWLDVPRLSGGGVDVRERHHGPSRARRPQQPGGVADQDVAVRAPAEPEPIRRLELPSACARPPWIETFRSPR